MKLKKIRIKLPWFFETELEREVSVAEDDQKIAWELYCDLITRIGVVEFKEDEDILLYCLDSWHEFFRIARNALKRLKTPIGSQRKIKTAKRKITESPTYLLSDIIIRLLNEELRPFLRKWHPYVRYFMKQEADQTKFMIEEQKKMPKWAELIEIVKDLHVKLKNTSNALYEIAVS
ncbi:MAG: hypothetical protein ACFFB5_23260 [Promethearchaeota archaeon]